MRRFAAIPAHPQKQYTRLWRLYHFCGFYYPIREVIPIAIYHWNIGIVSRGKGKSAVAAAAYRSGEKLTNEWDGMTHDYTRKGGVVHTEIMLPPHAPPSFSDRSTLWNSVELYEKAGNAQLAREIDEIPTVHMGVAACQMEKKGIATEKGELNRNIQKANRLIREIRAQIGKLKEWIADLFKARETAPEQPPQSPNLANLLMKYLSVQRENPASKSQGIKQIMAN